MQKEQWTIYTLLGNDETEREDRSRESAFRRGWHHGWVHAVDAIFSRLPKGDPEIDELYRQIAHFENNQVMTWRTDHSILPHSTPAFEVTPEQKESDEDETDDEWEEDAG